MCVGEVGDLKGPDVKLENLFYVEDCADIQGYEISKMTQLPCLSRICCYSSPI